MQANDGHWVSLVAFRLSASMPKAAKATKSCVNRSGTVVGVGTKQDGQARQGTSERYED